MNVFLWLTEPPLTPRLPSVGERCVCAISTPMRPANPPIYPSERPECDMPHGHAFSVVDLCDPNAPTHRITRPI